MPILVMSKINLTEIHSVKYKQFNRVANVFLNEPMRNTF